MNRRKKTDFGYREGLVRGNDTLFVSRGEDPKTAMSFAVNVNVIDPLTVKYETFYDEASKEIRTHMDITNQSTNNFNGSVEADYETGRSTQGTYSATVENLESGKSVRLEIPELARGQRTLKSYNDICNLLQTTLDSFNALLLPKLSKPVIDDKHEQSASDDAIWSGDSIQIGIGIANSDGTVPSEYHELGVARGNAGNLTARGVEAGWNTIVA